MTGITGRFVLLIVTAAIAPLVLYGVVSIGSLRSGTEESVSQGNLAVAQQVAARIGLYFANNARVLQSIAAELRSTDLPQWKRERILRNYVLDFPEFREITVFDDRRAVVATSRLTVPGMKAPTLANPGEDFYVDAQQPDADLLPTTAITVPSRVGGVGSGWIVAEISLEQLWRTVDAIRVGQQGYALLMDQQAKLIAHGNPNDKRRIAAGAKASIEEQRLAGQVRAAKTQAYRELTNPGQSTVLAAAAVVPNPDWTVLVEQPVSEAYAIANRLEYQLLAVIGAALTGTLALGWFWSRSFITRILALTRATRALAEGRMDERVALSGRDEIRQLGDSFNAMADRLVELQDEIRKQERQVMFGRIAAGLVHDINQPIMNIVNNCRVIVRMFDDADYRDEFQKIVERESAIVKRVLDDLRNIAQPPPLEHFPLDVNRTVTDVAEAMQQIAIEATVVLVTNLAGEAPYIEGDGFALGRVYRNLILNGIQATAAGGSVSVTTSARDERVQIRIEDTGVGIAPDRLAAMFEDFVTTKRRGLGLGLAIAKKIVEQLGGSIAVTSEVGVGTCFVLDFPRLAPAQVRELVGALPGRDEAAQ